MIEIENPLESFSVYPGPILLLAGPGTGKTTQLANRVKFLLEKKIASYDEISIITFTNEAAKNMRKRLNEPDMNLPESPHIITTMHSICNMIIGESPELADLSSDYSILTDQETRKTILMDASEIAVNDRDAYIQTDNCRRNGNCIEDMNKNKCKICSEYKNILRKCSAIDYDDQIFLACEILSKNKLILDEWQKKAKFLLVDEYQDINKAQFELIHILSRGQSEGLFVVGDDDQSIYSFRGGTPKFIKEFSSNFDGEIQIGRLKISWRCPEHILKGAKNIITKFYPESEKKPEPDFAKSITENNKIIFFDVPSFTKEATIISRMIVDRIKTNKIIIIIPNSKYFPPIKDALLLNKIPYKYKKHPDYNGLIKIAKINNWVYDKNNNLLLRYLIDQIIYNYNEILINIKDEQGLKKLRKKASNLISNLWCQVDKTKSLFEILQQQKCELTVELVLCLEQVSSIIEKYGTKKDHLSEFLKLCGKYFAPGKNVNYLISEINEWCNELYFTQFDSSVTPVEIYNLPSSKGLEGDVVFLIGATKDILPNSMNPISEQSRLFYVAMTRAKKELIIFNARSRPASITFKKQSFQLKRSEFISSIENVHIDIRYLQNKKKKST